MNKEIECIKTGSISTLTVGKTYEVLTESKKYYRVIGDDGAKHKFFKSYFKVVPNA